MQDRRMSSFKAIYSIVEAQAQMEELIERVQKGETIILTDGPDEEPVAKLAPIQPVES
jgi:antitoxin (DNA-binding transcriptional repressor) of toxin-antitoxin stability system